MPRRSDSPGFIESLARGLDVLSAFQPGEPTMTLPAVAAKTGLARPTAHRILFTLSELGYVRPTASGFSLTPKVMELGTAYVQSMGLWDVARPHMEDLVGKVKESCSIVQLDGSDIVYVARVAVPKIIGLTVHIGTRFPALQTALGKAILAFLDQEELEQALAVPTRSSVTPRWLPDRAERDAALSRVREQGWAVADEQLAQGIRSVAVPLHDNAGRVQASMNLNTNAAETTIDTLLESHLPHLLEAARAVDRDWALMLDAPQVVAPLTGAPEVPNHA